MKFISKIISPKPGIALSAFLLLLVIVFNFYGPYTSNFYFFKLSNYIFPLLTLVHFTYLYVIWFKISEHELTDPQMRNLEYLLYLLLLVYMYKIGESVYVLSTYSDYEQYVMPSTFLPLGVLILVSYILLIVLTFVIFKHRKEQIGSYTFEDMDKIDSWK